MGSFRELKAIFLWVSARDSVRAARGRTRRDSANLPARAWDDGALSVLSVDRCRPETLRQLPGRQDLCKTMAIRAFFATCGGFVVLLYIHLGSR